MRKERSLLCNTSEEPSPSLVRCLHAAAVIERSIYFRVSSLQDGRLQRQGQAQEEGREAGGGEEGEVWRRWDNLKIFDGDLSLPQTRLLLRRR